MDVKSLYIRGPFLKSLYKRFMLHESVEPVLNYMSNEFVALTNLCETGPRIPQWEDLKDERRLVDKWTNRYPPSETMLSETSSHYKSILFRQQIFRQLSGVTMGTKWAQATCTCLIMGYLEVTRTN